MSAVMNRSRAGLRPALAWGLAGAISMGMVLGTAPPEVQAAGPTITFRAWLDNDCVSGTAPRASKVRVTWKSAAGGLKKKGLVRAGKNGEWSMCSSSTVRRGDRLKARVGKVGRTVRVPRLDFEVDRDADAVSGVTKARRTLIVQYCYWSERYRRTRCDILEGRSAGDGRFSVDTDDSVTAYGDIRGGDRVTVFLLGGKDLFGRDQLTPYVGVRSGGSQLAGAYRPAATLAVHLLDEDGDPKADWSGPANGHKKAWSRIYKGYVRIAGQFSGNFQPGGQPVAVGDMFTSPALPPTPGRTVLDLQVSGDAATDVVQGTCATRTRFVLTATSPGGAKHAYPMAVSGQDGQFTRDLTGKLNLVEGSVIRLTCHEWTGDRVMLRVVVD